ncbi:MAG: hypothetical protein ABSG38_17385 [Spirochaetia bacterium]|jgi:hypothetical protein
MKIRLPIAIFALLVLGIPLFAQQTAVIQELTGRVQLKEANGEWADAAPGITVSQGTLISTGFNSTAVLDLGTSKIQVRPLTRMRLAELLRKGDTVTTSVFVTVGKVRADVQRIPSLTQAFKLQSPVSTAAVRGTQFTFAVTWVTTNEGVVEFQNAEGLGRDVGPGEGSELSGLQLPVSPSDYRAQQENVDPNTGPGEILPANGTLLPGTGSIVVTIQ